MRKLLLAMFCLVSTSVFANQKAFDLKVDLSVDGGAISSSKIVVKEGETGKMFHESNGQKRFIEVTAKEATSTEGRQTIHMEFIVGVVAADGTRTIISQPRIDSTPNETAQITVGAEGKPELSLTVVATQHTL